MDVSTLVFRLHQPPVFGPGGRNECETEGVPYWCHVAKPEVESDGVYAHLLVQRML